MARECVLGMGSLLAKGTVAVTPVPHTPPPAWKLGKINVQR